MRRYRIATAVAAALVIACQQSGNHGQASQHTESPPAHDSLRGWVGRWTGPEGTYLTIATKGTGFTLEIADLDGPRSFDGRAAGDHIQFERDGARESIRATDGPGTGMKWLQDKRDCLVIKPGEGFCRD